MILFNDSCNNKLIIFIKLSLIIFLFTTSSFSQTDKRLFRHSVHSANPKKVSILFDFTNTSELPEPIKVWDGLWVRILYIKHVKVKDGVFEYFIQFASDDEFKNILLPTNQPGHGITANGIAAFHFRNKDNTGPNEIGPKNVNAPQSVRIIQYKNFDAEVRILKFEIIGIGSSETVPSFAGIEFLVIVKENN